MLRSGAKVGPAESALRKGERRVEGFPALCHFGCRGDALSAFGGVQRCGGAHGVEFWLAAFKIEAPRSSASAGLAKAASYLARSSRSLRAAEVCQALEPGESLHIALEKCTEVPSKSARKAWRRENRGPVEPG